MRFGRADLENFGPNLINVPHKDIMMCLNESPYNPLSDLRSEIFNDLAGIDANRYFSPITSALRAQLADYAGVAEDQILMGNGADELLYYFFVANRQSSQSALLMPAPSYFDYLTYSRAVGMRQITVDLDSYMQIDRERWENIIKQKNITCAVICNPNNPTGNLMNSIAIEEIISGTDKPVIIDEAYFEFSGTTMVDLVEHYDNMFLLRTFSKGFFAAGLRFGYIIGSRQGISELKKVFTAFNMSLVIQSIAQTFLRNQDYFTEKRDILISERHRLYKSLLEVDGIDPLPTETNFVTFRCPGIKKELHSFIGRRNIAIRDVSGHPLLQDCLRVTIGLPMENSLFMQALSDFLTSQRA